MSEAKLSCNARSRPPPGNLAVVDDQSSSELCVRSAIAKAVANHLFVHNQIDIDQAQIMICLVQALGDQFGTDAVNPAKYDGVILYLQDKENLLPKPVKCCNGCAGGCKSTNGVPNKSWWKVSLICRKLTVH